MCCKSPYMVGIMGVLLLTVGLRVGYRIQARTFESSTASPTQSHPPTPRDLAIEFVTDEPTEPSDEAERPSIGGEAPKDTGSREQFRLAFEHVWKTIESKHWESNPNGLNWKAIRDEFEPQIASATEAAQVDQILNAMLGRLKQSHFGIVPASQYEPLGSGEDLSGSIGVALRMVEGKPTVWRVNSASSAGQQGVSPGWVLVQRNETKIVEQLNKIDELESPSYSPALLKQLVLGTIDKGAVGKSAKFVWLNAKEQETSTEIVFGEPIGKRAVLGNLPPFYVESNSKVVDGDIAYFQLSSFFDPQHIIPQFSDLLSEQASAPGLIIDLRGNPGGIAFMASSLGGFLVKTEGVYLGTMNTRDTALRFTLMPRDQVFDGKVAVLVDELSMSTSEIFAGGLQDIGRARVFGRSSAGMALPSLVEKLAYGSGFQYAFASYTSAGGKSLESHGVVPNESIALDRQSLADGRDLDMEAAIRWIRAAKPIQ